MKGTRIQVPASHYEADYDSPERFASYWAQIDVVQHFGSFPVLEIGLGTGTVSRYLARRGRVVTLDLDRALRPSAVGEISKLPFANACFNTSVACQVLEHLPWASVRAALVELRRVTQALVIVSVPDASRTARIHLKVPGIRAIDVLISLAWILPRGQFKPDAQHHWELGWRNIHTGSFCNVASSAGFTVLSTFRVQSNPYHRFFILK